MSGSVDSQTMSRVFGSFDTQRTSRTFGSFDSPRMSRVYGGYESRRASKFICEFRGCGLAHPSATTIPHRMTPPRPVHVPSQHLDIPTPSPSSTASYICRNSSSHPNPQNPNPCPIIPLNEAAGCVTSVGLQCCRANDNKKVSPSRHMKQENKSTRGAAVIAFDPTLSLSISEPPRLLPDYIHPRTRYEPYWVWRSQPAPSSSSQSTPSLVAVLLTLGSTEHRAGKEVGRGLMFETRSEGVSSPSVMKRKKIEKKNLLAVS